MKNTFVGTLMAVPVMLISIAAGIVGGLLEFTGRARFTPDAWSDPERVRRDLVRSRSVADLLGRHELVGLGRDQVIAMLGAGDTLPGAPPDRALAYWLGPELALGEDHARWLVLDLDAAGIVRGHRIMLR